VISRKEILNRAYIFFPDICLLLLSTEIFLCDRFLFLHTKDFMKRLALLAVLLFTPFTFHANPREDLLYAITESDYESFMKIYNSNNFSQESLRNFNDLANRMIMVRGEWMTMHAFYPQVGKDLFYAALWGFAGAGIISLTDEKNHSFDESAKPNDAAKAAALLIGLPCLVFCIKNILAAFQRPKVLLTDAIRIKDALAMHE
jgi:hypothetical protein